MTYHDLIWSCFVFPISSCCSWSFLLSIHGPILSRPIVSRVVCCAIWVTLYLCYFSLPWPIWFSFTFFHLICVLLALRYLIFFYLLSSNLGFSYSLLLYLFFAHRFLLYLNLSYPGLSGVILSYFPSTGWRGWLTTLYTPYTWLGGGGVGSCSPG